MKTVAAFAVLAVAAAASREEMEARFVDHMKQYNLEFPGTEFIERLKIFITNDAKIAAHNAKADKTFTLAHNMFSHLTVEEWKDMFTGVRRPQLRMPGGERKTAEEILGGKTLPDSVDWVAMGAVTPVKDQGQCGSCWSFSTTGALEGAYAVKTGSLVSFSEQQLVDCDTTLNMGCNGGMMDRAFRYIRNTGGLCTEGDYPYVSGVTQTAGTCQTSCQRVAGSTVSSWTDLDQTDAAMMAALATHGPVSIAVDAEEDAFMFYSSGVVTANCGTSLDHGVLAVGYGTDANGIQYYKVKNSWSAAWGQGGFIYLGRNVAQKGGMCGILSSASYPSL